MTTPCISTGLPLAIAPDGAMISHKPQDSLARLARSLCDALYFIALDLYSWTKGKRILCIRLEAKVKRVSQKQGLRAGSAKRQPLRRKSPRSAHALFCVLDILLLLYQAGSPLLRASPPGSAGCRRTRTRRGEGLRTAALQGQGTWNGHAYMSCDASCIHIKHRNRCGDAHDQQPESVDCCVGQESSTSLAEDSEDQPRWTQMHRTSSLQASLSMWCDVGVMMGACCISITCTMIAGEGRKHRFNKYATAGGAASLMAGGSSSLAVGV